LEKIKSFSPSPALVGTFNMEQIPILTKNQKIILTELAKIEFIQKNFYFTGGTALAYFYLQHRLSEDLDFFSEKKFDNQPLISFFEDLRKKYHFQLKTEQIENVNSFYLYLPDKEKLKIDFNYYPFKRVRKSILKEGVWVDSLFDIAINKLITIIQRTDVKDFVDFYFLEPKFGVWDLIEGVRVKFRQKIEPYLLASDFLKVEDFEFLPRMVKPLSLEELKIFFRKLAKKVGMRAVEK